MDFLQSQYNNLINNSAVSLSLLAGAGVILFVLFLIQLVYYVGVYGRLHRFRNGVKADAPSEPVSVIVVIRENTYYYLENYLPLLLNQDYGEYEVVVVDCSYNEEIGTLLEGMERRFPRLKTTRIKAQPNYEHSIKLALTVGVKASSYENLLFTTADSFPTSDKWVSLMAKGFITGDVVLGYCGIEPRPGFTNKWMRCSRLLGSVRYLSSATRGEVYRGISHNIGYTKSLYFANKGFNYLNLNTGDDDLFIRKIASGRSTSVVIHPKATVRQIQYGGLGWWNSVCKYFSYTYRYYPVGVRFRTAFELGSRLLFFLTAALLIWWLPLFWKAVPILFVLLRLAVVEYKIGQINRRVGEKGLGWAYVVYDFLSPCTEAILALNRRIRPNKAIWR